MKHDAEYYLPENHQYVENETYSGPDCAICGKPQPGHKEETSKR